MSIDTFQTYIGNKFFKIHQDFTLQTFLTSPKKNKTIKFQFPLQLPPEPNIRDDRTPYQIVKDIYGILGNTPSIQYKQAVDELLGRDSEIPEINSNGLEMSTQEIRKQVEMFQSAQKKNVKKVILNTFLHSGPIFFTNIIINDKYSIPVLIDSGASNTTISTFLLKSHNIKYDLDSSFKYIFENSTESASDSLLGTSSFSIQFYSSNSETMSPMNVTFLILDSPLPYILLGGTELCRFEAFSCYACPLVMLNYNGKAISLYLYKDKYLTQPYTHRQRCHHPESTLPTKCIEQDQIVLSLQGLDLHSTPSQHDQFSNNINARLPPPLFTEISEDEILEKLDESLPEASPVDAILKNIHLPAEFDFLKQEITALLSTYQHLHPISKQDVGKIKNYEATLIVKNGFKLPQEMPRHMSDEKRRVASLMEEELLAADVIEFSNSPYASNALITPKAVFGQRISHSKADSYLQKMEHKQAKSYSVTQKYRYTIDYRRLNMCLEKPPKICLPTDVEIAQIMHPPNTHMLSVDISNAFHSIPYSEESKKYTAFWSSSRTKMAFKRTPQGVSNSPFFFSDATKPHFQDSSYRKFCVQFKYTYDPIFDRVCLFIVVYCDDILISCNKANALQRLHFILYTLHTIGLKMDFSKMILFTEKLHYLGTEYNIRNRTHRIKEDRRSSLLSFRTPTSYAELLSRLASFNYTSPYLLGLKLVSLPLLRLLAKGRNNEKWVWTDLHHKSWINLKYLLHLAVTLHIPDGNNPLVVISDSNKISPSAALYEYSEDKKQLYLVNTFDKLFAGAALRYGISRKEMISLLIAFQRWEPAIRNAPYVLALSDCRAISYVWRMRNSTSALFEAAIFLSSFMNTSFGFIPGIYNKLSHQLTRQFVGSELKVDIPPHLLTRMPEMLRPTKNQILDHHSLSEIIWTDIKMDENYTDLSNYKTMVKNPPLNIESCIQDLIYLPTEEAYINYLLGASSKLHLNHPRLNKLSKTKLAKLSTLVQRDRVQSEIKSITNRDSILQNMKILSKPKDLSLHQVEEILKPFENHDLSSDLRNILSALQHSKEEFKSILTSLLETTDQVLPVISTYTCTNTQFNLY